MSAGPSDPADGIRWEFIWWGFRAKESEEDAFSPEGTLVHRFRLGPLEIRGYSDMPPKPDLHRPPPPEDLPLLPPRE